MCRFPVSSTWFHQTPSDWLDVLTRFDDGVSSAGFVLSPRGIASLGARNDAPSLWRVLLELYPTLALAFGEARPLMPIAFRPIIQHRLTRAVERLTLAFESARRNKRVPHPEMLGRYDASLAAEADQIDLLVAGAYEAMSHFDLFAAQAMLYFATVSFAEATQRLAPKDSAAYNEFLGVGDPVLEVLPRESLRKLREITQGRGEVGSATERADFAAWMEEAIAPRNIAGLADPARRNLYPVDFDALIERHDLLGMSRGQLLEALPALRGMTVAPRSALLEPVSSRERF